jgi:signal transduction histidine kinase
MSDFAVERFRSFGRSDGVKGGVVGAFDAFFSAASAGLMLVDADLRCLQVNEHLAAITGLPLDSHRGQRLLDVLPAAIEPTLREVLRSGEAIDKVPLQLGGRSILGTFFPVFGDDRSVAGLGGILIDVTENERREAELRAAIEIRERVLAVVSHDLRNPLGTIQLAVSTMPDATCGDPEASRRIVMVERASKLMETLICDLLDMATIQTGTLTLHRADESAEMLVLDAIELHAPLANERGIYLLDATKLVGVRVSCDRARILQVLGNLCGNAIKFCQRGASITIRGYAEERSLVLEIADTGPGIPATDIPHLFEQYWSTARGRTRGTGLGLFICNALVQAHGGELTVTSTVGVGTTFRMVLPLGPA